MQHIMFIWNSFINEMICCCFPGACCDVWRQGTQRKIPPVDRLLPSPRRRLHGGMPGRKQQVPAYFRQRLSTGENVQVLHEILWRE